MSDINKQVLLWNGHLFKIRSNKGNCTKSFYHDRQAIEQKADIHYDHIHFLLSFLLLLLIVKLIISINRLSRLLLSQQKILQKINLANESKISEFYWCRQQNPPHLPNLLVAKLCYYLQTRNHISSRSKQLAYNP